MQNAGKSLNQHSNTPILHYFGILGMNVSGKHILVVGLGKSGLSVVRWLAKKGARVAGSEIKTAGRSGERAQLNYDLESRWRIGGTRPGRNVYNSGIATCLNGLGPRDAAFALQTRSSMLLWSSTDSARTAMPLNPPFSSKSATTPSQTSSEQTTALSAYW